MGLYNVFNISGSSMSAQSVRLNTVASNLANADSVSTNEKDAYRSRQPVFAAVMEALNPNQASASVRVSGIVESQAELATRYAPDNPNANAFETMVFNEFISDKYIMLQGRHNFKRFNISSKLKPALEILRSVSRVK